MACVYKEGQRFHLNPWEYNACRILSALADVVREHGGNVKPTIPCEVSDRSVNGYNAPITVTHTTYITFELDGMYYYYQVEENPFFPFFYIKTPIDDGKKFSRDACLEEENKEWLLDCFFKSECPSEMIIKAAEFIFDMLMNAKNSQIIRDCKKTRVPNTYDSGWHYEYVYAKERFAQIDF